MLIAIAAAVSVTIAPLPDAAPVEGAPAEAVKPEPKAASEVLDHIRVAACPAGVVVTGSTARYDRGAVDAPSLDRQPYRGDVQLFSAVERRVGNCSEPVIRARASVGGPAIIIEPAAPVDR